MEFKDKTVEEISANDLADEIIGQLESTTVETMKQGVQWSIMTGLDDQLLKLGVPKNLRSDILANVKLDVNDFWFEADEEKRDELLFTFAKMISLAIETVGERFGEEFAVKFITSATEPLVFSFFKKIEEC